MGMDDNKKATEVYIDVSESEKIDHVYDSTDENYVLPIISDPFLADKESIYERIAKNIRYTVRKLVTIYRRCFPKYDFEWKHTEEEYQEIERDEYYLMIVNQEFIPASSIKIDKSGFEFPWHGHSYDDFERLRQRYERCLRKYSINGGRKSAIGIKRWFPDVYEAFFKSPISIDTETGSIGDGRHRVYVLARHNLNIPVWKVDYKLGKDISFLEYSDNEAIGGWRF